MRCTSCGAGIPTNAPVPGVCPACLLETVSRDDWSSPDSGEATTLTPGSTVGPFQIARLLGSGGMASVYEGYEERLARHVALKVLPPAMLHDHTFEKRFEREARLVATLEHPHIVPIYASGIDHGMPWLSMRLLPGGTLSSLLATGPLTPERSVGILRGVADAIDYAHARGVLHRDIKPSNIVLDERGIGCLVDFGVARLMERDSALTFTGMVIGTPQYMSPEQAAGKKVDRHADIYSLGIVAYEMLTGAPPFSGESAMAILMKQIESPPPVPPRDVVSKATARVLLRALSKTPSERWPTAVSFVDALDVAIASHGQSGWRTIVRWSAVGGLTTTAAAAALITIGPRYLPSLLDLGVPAIPAPPPLDTPPVGPTEDERRDAAMRLMLEAVINVPTSPTPPRSPGAREAPTVNTVSSQQLPDDVEPGAVTVSPAPLQGGSTSTSTSQAVSNPGGTAPNIEQAPAAPMIEAITQATMARSSPPVYPAFAKAAEIEGTVLVEARCEIDGRLSNPVVLQSAHPSLVDAALKSVLASTCQPRVRNGTPEASPLQIPIEFRLK